MMIVILDNIRSVANVGSVFRTADALDVERIYLTGITPAPVDVFGKIRPEMTKVSLGSESHVPWEKKISALKVIAALASNGYRVLAVEQSARSVPYYRVRIGKNSAKVAIVLGSETKGLSSRMLACADGILEIPMRGIKESLNVSVAFGIVAFHLIYGGKR